MPLVFANIKQDPWSTEVSISNLTMEYNSIAMVDDILFQHIFVSGNILLRIQWWLSKR